MIQTFNEILCHRPIFRKDSNLMSRRPSEEYIALWHLAVPRVVPTAQCGRNVLDYGDAKKTPREKLAAIELQL
jgi:hypothetical protein